MIYSMTGFGKAEGAYKNAKISVEIKSLNSKTLDLSTRVPSRYKSYDLEFRKLAGDKLLRGKVDMYISVEYAGEEIKNQLNQDLVKEYISQIEALGVTVSPEASLKMAIRMPDVFSNNREVIEVDEEEVKAFTNTIGLAIKELESFRRIEGESLHKVFEEYLGSISTSLTKIEGYEQARIDEVKQRILKSLEELGVAYDEQRFHQELVYYIEKLDINEEKTRLNQHLSYFKDTMKDGNLVGKKLGFIAQEMGREINTIGSKANHSEIQKLVVLMKDELEKIKEQVNNVL